MEIIYISLLVLILIICFIAGIMYEYNTVYKEICKQGSHPIIAIFCCFIDMIAQILAKGKYNSVGLSRYLNEREICVKFYMKQFKLLLILILGVATIFFISVQIVIHNLKY